MYKSIVFVLAFVAIASADVIENTQCSKGRDSRNIQSSVSEVRVTPCPEAADDEPCELRKGTTAVIEVDFTATKSMRRPKAGMYWMSKVDLPFRGLSVNACRFMSCPVNEGSDYKYNANITLARNLPAGLYPIKFKLYHNRDVLVCQTFTIRLLEADE